MRPSLERLQNQGKYKSCIAKLGLSGNDIKEAGASALKTAILNSTTLRTLSLGWNPLGRQGADEIIQLLEVRELTVISYCARLTIQHPVHRPMSYLRTTQGIYSSALLLLLSG